MKRAIVFVIDLADPIGCLFLPKLRYLWRFECGHEELRVHRTVSGNGARGGVFFGICKQCSCCASEAR